jgi:DNA invertase Pin-like site-specific DNA recombinase
LSPAQETVKKVAIYCRVSTTDQDWQRQEKELLDCCHRAGYEIVEIFHESASGADDERPERAKAIALAQARKIDTVLVTELTRWGRSTSDLIDTTETLVSKGVSLEALQGLDFDLSTPQGKLLRTIFAGLAEFERDLIRDRVKSGMANARAQGKHCGRPSGFSKKAFDSMPTVMELKSDGYSHQEIANQVQLSKRTVIRLLKSQFSAGNKSVT